MEEHKRKLASIQIIDKLTPIEGADKIEQASLVDLGWSFVVKKGEFKSGDKCVYFEIDSILPEKDEYEFLRSRKFRIKTIKLKGTISQGLVIPVPEGMQNIPTGTDITDAMGVKKYDPQAQEEAALSIPKHRSKVMQYLMQFKACRYIYLKLNSQEKGNWPGWLSRTDEERIQNCAKILLNNYDQDWYISEKLDGCLDENTLIETQNDGVKTIKEICETEYKGKILAFNINKNKAVYTKISHHSIKDNNNDWYEINYNDKIIKLTGEHLVWLPELNCYREVKNLKETDKILIFN